MVQIASQSQLAPISKHHSRETPRAIFDAHFDFVWRCAFHFGVDRSDVDDVVQETFLVAFRRLALFDEARSMRAWLVGIAFNCARDYRRARRSRREDPDDVERIAVAAPVADRSDVRRALESLDEDERALVIMHDVEGFTMPEIAPELGITADAGYARLHSARERLRAALTRIATEVRS